MPENRSQCLGMKQTSTISNMWNFRSSKSVHLEAENPFLSPLYASPSLLLQEPTDLRSSSGSYYSANSALNHAAVMPNWPLLHNNGNSNSKPAVDVHPLFLPRPPMTGNNCGSYGLCDDLNALRVLIPRTSPKNETLTSTYVQKGVMISPLSTADSEMSHGSTSNSVVEASLHKPSSVSTKRTSVMNECPLVFCMGACGDLLLSSTGVLGILCSCHGLNMSVSNFCKHSGLSDVIPGYAVRMDSGESIAQWRKVYFQKFGITAPEDHRGWDWPDGLLSTSGFMINGKGVADRGKVFDLSSLFAPPRESVEFTQPWNNSSTSKPHSSHGYANQMSKNDQRENGCDRHNSLHMGSISISKRNSHTMTDSPIIGCPTLSCLMSSRASEKGVSGDDRQSGSFHFNIIPTRGNSLSSASQNLQTVGSKTKNNVKDNIYLQGSALSSSIDLKLGQPSQQGQDTEPTALSAVRPRISDSVTTLQEQLTHNLGNSKVIGKPNTLHPCCHALSDLSRAKQNFQLDLLNNAPSIANGAYSVQPLEDVLSKSSVISILDPPSNTSAGDNAHNKESNMGIDYSHPSFHWGLHYQPHRYRSAPTEFLYNGGNGRIRPLNINGSAMQQNEHRTTATRCGHNYSDIGSESSFRFYAKKMESSGFFTRPDQKFDLFRMDSMLPDSSDASTNIGNVCSLGSSTDLDRFAQRVIDSSSSFGPIFQETSTGFSPLMVGLAPGCESSLYKQGDTANSFMSDERLRTGNAEKSFKEKPVNASLGFNRQARIYSDIRQKRKNCSISDLRVQGSFLDSGPSEGKRHGHSSTIGHAASPFFLHNAVGKKGDDIRNRSTLESKGTNSDGLGAFTRAMPLHSETMVECNQGSSDPQKPKDQPSLRAKNKASDYNILQRCSGGPYPFSSGGCHCTVQTMYSNKDQHSKSTNSTNGFKKQVTVANVEASTLNDSKIFKESAPVEEATLVECNEKVKEQMRCKLDCMDSQWRDVPSKGSTVPKVKPHDAPVNLSCKGGEAEDHSKELGAKDIPKSDQLVELLKGKELSSISSGCCEPTLTQTSMEVQKIDSCTVDAGDTGYDNDQIVDQGFGVDRSWSSCDAVDSVRSSQHLCSSKARSTEEQSLTLLPNVACQGPIGELEQKLSKSKELQNLDASGASSDEVSNNIHTYESWFKPRKRKHRIKWRTLETSMTVSDVSMLPSESPLHAGNAANHQTRNFLDVQVCLQSNQDSSSKLDANSKDNGLKRMRSALSSIKMRSRKRYLNGIYSMLDGEGDDQRTMMGNDSSVAISENAAVRRLRQVKLAEAVKKRVNSTEAAEQLWLYNSNCKDSDETPKCSFKGCQKAMLVDGENVRKKKAKPVACGKYGIICNQELDMDQLKPPKIVPLSHVLKASRRHTKFQNKPRLPSLRKRNKICFSWGSKCNDKSFNFRTGLGNKVLSCKVGEDDTSIPETVPTCHNEDETFVDDLLVLEKVGNGSERNLSASSCCLAIQSKQKGIRMRSLYELSMRGKRFISVDFSLSQNVTCALSAEQKLENSASDNARTSDFGKFKGDARRSLEKPHCSSLVSELDGLCCVCGISTKDKTNCLLECGHCSIRVHQACYGISRVPKGDWYCRPCRTASRDVACVLCGYGGGAMTRAFGSRNVVKRLLKAWNIRPNSRIMRMGLAETLYVPANMECENKLRSAKLELCPLIKPVVHNSIIAGLFDRTIKQWVHMVCGLWTPGTCCRNVETMSAFDVSGVSHPRAHVVCYICKRPGGSCIPCRIESCCTRFHPWCAHQKGLLQSEVEGVNNDNLVFYGRCLLHADHQPCSMENDNNTCGIDCETDQETCARTEGYKGKKLKDRRCSSSYRSIGKDGCSVSPVQLDAWLYINRRKMSMQRLPKPPVSHVEHDYRKEYARYKQEKRWKHLVVYKSGIHALGLYTSQFIPRCAMVVEYVGEIVGLHVADRRENEYQSGRKLQYKSACYFFRIDKEQIIDATCKGGIARFVNHSCQPNCVAKVITVRGEKKVVFLAQRDIYPGEEITYDYHFNREDEGKKIPCFCNSRNCRHYLN